jgi:hypothetical protein
LRRRLRTHVRAPIGSPAVSGVTISSHGLSTTGSFFQPVGGPRQAAAPAPSGAGSATQPAPAAPAGSLRRRQARVGHVRLALRRERLANDVGTSAGITSLLSVDDEPRRISWQGKRRDRRHDTVTQVALMCHVQEIVSIRWVPR